MILFTKGTELTKFAQLKVPMTFSINLNLNILRLLRCLHRIFSTLNTTLPHHLIRINLLIELAKHLFGRISSILLATKNVLFSLLIYTRITIMVLSKKYVMPLSTFWIIFLLDLELNFIGKLLVFDRN